LIQSAPDIQAIFLAPETQQALRANVVITLRPVEPAVTVQDVAAYVRQMQPENYAQFTPEIEQSILAGNVEGIHTAFRWFDSDEKLWVSQSQWFFIHAEVLYTLTSTCDNQAKENIQPIVDEMVSSFRISTADPLPFANFGGAAQQ
jgi:hypothetical protein